MKNNKEENNSIFTPGYIGSIVVTDIIAETPWYKECINSFLDLYPTIKPYIQPFLNHPTMTAAFGGLLIKCGFPYLVEKWNQFFNNYKNKKNIKENNNSISDNIKNTIKSYYTTLTDYIQYIFPSFLGTDENIGIILQNMYKNNNLSNKITKIFTNTKVHIYVFESKIPQAFTIPGFTNLDPYLFKFILSLPLIHYYFGFFVFLFMNIIKTINVYDSNYTESQIKYDNVTKKIIIPLNELTCYVSNTMLETLNDDEIIAVLLHEVGHNTMIILSICSQIFNIIGLIMGTVITYYEFLTIIKVIIDGQLTITNDFAVFIIITILVTFFLKYLSRRQEIYADEFAIKCGYGTHLKNALNKIKNFIYTDSIIDKLKSSIKINIFDKFLHFIMSIKNRIYNLFAKFHMSEYPSWDNRIDMIDKKTQKFNNDLILNKNKEDRSKHLNIAW